MIQDIDFNDQQVVNYFDLVPYWVNPQKLYTAATLYDGYDVDYPETFCQCYDQKVYSHYIERGKLTQNVLEAMARGSHDFGVCTAVAELLDGYDENQIIGVMGGNAMLRNELAYEKIARISKRLTEDGFLMVSGGGSGAMEATGFGAWMAGRGEPEFQEALNRLKAVPEQRDVSYIEASMRIVLDFPQDTYDSLSIPTWLYGHEWTSPFATHIAKLFQNSIREDGLLTISYGGIIYAPGRAGTVQEVFQKAVQNHYLTFGFATPMIFLDKQFWTEIIPIYPMLDNMQKKGIYHHLPLHLTDDIDEVVRIITSSSASSSPNLLQ